MQVPLEISYKNITKSQWIEDFINRQVERLHRYAGDIISCRVAIELEQRRHRKGNPYHTRVEVTLPGKKHLVTHAKPAEVEVESDYELRNVIRDAFRSMEKRLKKTQSEKRQEVKTHHEPHAIVTKLFPEEGYGFLKEIGTDEEIYFHQNSVLHNDFDRLSLGTEVRYVSEMGEEGLQASTVQIVSKPGEITSPGEQEPDVPEGWKSQH